MNPEWISALWGGVLIGVSVSLMLYWNGRVAGISGILFGLLNPARGDTAWRVSFILGMVMGGLTLVILRPVALSGVVPVNGWVVAVAGFLVGFGTVLGGGCTSGHGVCGISRLSLRSIVATGVFILAGMLSVFLAKHMGALS